MIAANAVFGCAVGKRAHNFPVIPVLPFNVPNWACFALANGLRHGVLLDIVL